MKPEHLQTLARELNIKVAQVAATAELIAGGGTVPFIARYRKEATGMLDEVAITGIRDGMLRLAQLDDRREAILKSLDERKLLTDLLKAKILAAETITALEDIFAPFRPKRRTRATIAKEKGLEPLADWLEANQTNTAANPQTEAVSYIKTDGEAEQQVATADEALAGARDIIAERVSDHADARAAIRKLIAEQGTVSSKVMFGKEEDQEAAKFRDYFDWSEPLKNCPSHRMLAMRRGEKEGFIIMRITAPEADALRLLENLFVKGNSAASKQIVEAVHDGYKRLLQPSMETEARLENKKKADAEAVRVFADNLRELLLAAPLGQKRVMGVDPGFRTGCKITCLDAQGKLLHNDVIYLLGEGNNLLKAKALILALVDRFKIEAVAIGNGTASRETEMFFNRIGLPSHVSVVMVNESGASIYSASDVAREEFPDHDITVRGSVSIARRLMDPLAELVKIDPKSIGVGQYQHDVDQNLLKDSLDDTVQSSVNAVGVEVNTASKQLLSYVAGLNSTLAANIVSYRNENGPFKSRAELKKVPRLGDKAFEQAAGFLRIRGAENPLDSSAVHPERYDLVKIMARDLSSDIAALLGKEDVRKRIDLKKYVSETVGLPTLQDIVNELAKPGRDPRKQFEIFKFQEGVEKPEDLQVGMKLPGIVTNVTAFGAFVDIGVHQDGLVHVSQLADHFIKDASEVVKVQQRVQVTVVEVDLQRKRIALSMKANPDFEKRGQPGGARPAQAGGGGGNRSFGGGGGGSRNNSNSGGGGGGMGGGDWFSAAVTKGKK
ncbi:RNA-binding transcriptional accessory protein [Phragmitibacter flavus]|uniref:RNA-binding transcriptional accessory protein n=1 Tax=Phragmitibacter flavus TaxID=2576071 RepID=A0A5R8KLL3_9BACT|nr:Tex family protein [Phragmitibacter flavus]TLD72629.1 RNA-binding transcriptional accessory protein [Phragmitibacter flavus]